MFKNLTQISNMSQNMGHIPPEVLAELEKNDHKASSGIRKVMKLYTAELKVAEHFGYAKGWLKGGFTGYLMGCFSVLAGAGGYQLYKKLKPLMEPRD